MPPPARRTVYTLYASARRGAHERASQEWVARRIAALLGWDFGGEHGPRRATGRRAYFVPDETLTTAQAAALGIESEDDLFGGVVPHAFVASKVITHPLPTADSAAPEGWVHALAPRLAGSVLAGFSVFDPGAIEAAGLRLLAAGGTVRIKEAQARGGNGQHLVDDATALRAVAARLDPEGVRRHGVVLEQHLERALTCSVGEIRIGGRCLGYLGNQHQVSDRGGQQVYGGSSLRVVEGGLDALEALPGAATGSEAEALRHARRYDAAVGTAYPGFFASRRNYDVVAGEDAQGRRRCGVLEQSWRMGGASPAEILALAAFLGARPPPALEVSCHESHDPGHIAPPQAEVHFHDPGASRGPVIKYALPGRDHGNPA